MSLLPDTDRILLGPGPSLTAPRVMRAMASPTISHLDPLMLRLLDDVRARLKHVFRAPDGAFAFAVSGTGTSGMETAVANLVREGTRATVVVTGYFGDRLAQMCERYGATVTRLDVEWGRACDPDALRRQLQAGGADIVAMVHAETSTGVLRPSLTRFVKLAVAMTRTSSTICSALKCRPIASRSSCWTDAGQAVSFSVKWMAARSCSLKTFRFDPPGSLSAWICSSLRPCRFAEAT